MASMKQHTYEAVIRPSVVHRASQNSRNSQTSRASRGSSSRTDLLMQDQLMDLPMEMKPKLFKKSSSSAISDLPQLDERGKKTGKSYWQDVINDVEFAVRCMAEPRIPLIDYSLVLPPRLRERVKHIQRYDYSKSDENIYIREEMREERPQDFMSITESDSEEQEVVDEATLLLSRGRKKVEEYFNESDHSDIVRMDHEFDQFDLKLDEPVGHTHRTIDRTSWLAKYLCAPREKRVQWKSRVERKNVEAEDALLTLDEQAENLMDASAERFVLWLNSIGSCDTSLTPEKVKGLFSIKGDRTLLASIKTDPKEVNAIAQTVADKWNKPHMAIELKYEKHINDQANRKFEKPLLSAFGRTVPLKERPWLKRSEDTVIETVYPQELLTREKIFKGITHLRSTTALIDFYLNNRRLARPRYLLQTGDFEDTNASELATEVPLYEYLGLRY